MVSSTPCRRGSNLKIKKCKSCETYTLKDACPSCGGQVVSPHPPKFSPHDPYGRYRRMMKKEALQRG